jgi:hypothetical protein
VQAHQRQEYPLTRAAPSQISQGLSLCHSKTLQNHQLKMTLQGSLASDYLSSHLCPEETNAKKPHEFKWLKTGMTDTHGCWTQTFTACNRCYIQVLHFPYLCSCTLTICVMSAMQVPDACQVIRFAHRS